MKSAEDQTIEAVRLARDLCMGMGAFVVSTSGDVRFELAAPGHTGNLGERVAVLARSCLERPGAQGNEPFWNAEILGDDESADDSSACCTEPTGPNTRAPGGNGPGGGRVGAVLVSPFIKPGTTPSAAYNHYSLLRTIEDLFGLPHLGEAAQPGLDEVRPVLQRHRPHAVHRVLGRLGHPEA